MLFLLKDAKPPHLQTSDFTQISGGPQIDVPQHRAMTYDCHEAPLRKEKGVFS